MNKQHDFINEIASATGEIFGGSSSNWLAKVISGILIALIQSIEASSLAIAAFLGLCILDAILGVMRVIKRNKRNPNKPNIPVNAWRMISGPASKWFVGGVVLMSGSFFDHVMFGNEAVLGGPVLKFFSGVVLGAILIEVTAKADYLQGWGITVRLRKRFPELFAAE